MGRKIPNPKKYHFRMVIHGINHRLEDYETLKPVIEEFGFEKNSAKVLIVGCGNSEFSENMYDDGWKNIKNNDISKSVIESMSNRSLHRSGMICNK